MFIFIQIQCEDKLYLCNEVIRIYIYICCLATTDNYAKWFTFIRITMWMRMSLIFIWMRNGMPTRLIEIWYARSLNSWSFIYIRLDYRNYFRMLCLGERHVPESPSEEILEYSFDWMHSLTECQQGSSSNDTLNL